MRTLQKKKVSLFKQHYCQSSSRTGCELEEVAASCKCEACESQTSARKADGDKLWHLCVQVEEHREVV